MNIRPINKDDIAACAAMFVRSYNRAHWNYNWDHENAVNYLQEYLDSPHFAGFVVTEGTETAAALFGHQKTWWTGQQFFVDELFVSPSYQGKGYGKKLLACAEDFATRHDLNVVFLMTNKFMPAYDFYIKESFIQADQFVCMFKPVG